MQRWGRTAQGTQRYRCVLCKKTEVIRRPDARRRRYQKSFVSWLTSHTRLEDSAHRAGVTTQTLRHRFDSLWHYVPKPQPTEQDHSVLVVDALSVVHRLLVVLISHDPLEQKPVWWSFASRETYAYWLALFRTIEARHIHPIFVVCDGHKGLIKALFEVWPRIRMQRCMAHVIRHARALLTQRPQTQAGQELLHLIKQLPRIRTRRHKRRWIRSYRRCLKRHHAFLKERTPHPVNKRKWWYTHRKLRAVRSLIKNSIDHLFTYVRHPHVPRTTNHVEGGINSRLAELLRSHRGLSPRHQQILVAWYLAIRQGQKPTRNFH